MNPKKRKINEKNQGVRSYVKKQGVRRYVSFRHVFKTPAVALSSLKAQVLPRCSKPATETQTKRGGIYTVYLSEYSSHFVKVKKREN